MKITILSEREKCKKMYGLLCEYIKVEECDDRLIIEYDDNDYNLSLVRWAAIMISKRHNKLPNYMVGEDIIHIVRRGKVRGRCELTDKNGILKDMIRTNVSNLLTGRYFEAKKVRKVIWGLNKKWREVIL